MQIREEKSKCRQGALIDFSVFFIFKNRILVSKNRLVRIGTS
jgi:hypothetical protein